MIYVVVCGYRCENTLQRCLESVKMQRGAEYKTLVSIETDRLRKYLLKNTIDTIRSVKMKPDDIIVLLDADDFFIDEQTLDGVQRVHSNGTLVTHGSYVNLSTNSRGKFNGRYENGESFRTSKWRGSHLKTFKRKIFDQVPEECYKDDRGEYFKCCADRATMIPMMELAGHERVKFIPLLTYCYNDLNERGVWKTMKVLSKSNRELISKRKPLKVLSEVL